MGWLVAAVVLPVVAYGVWSYPVGGGWLALGLVVYGTILWCRPMWWLLLVPALLPVLDFATWTGWLYFDEFDLMLLVTLTVLSIRSPVLPKPSRIPPLAKVFLIVFVLAYGISTLRGLLPLQPLDANAFANYYSHYNALRVAKGLIWALLLLPFLATALRDKTNLQRYVLPGFLGGLAATTSMAIWERWLFPGLFNFSSDYRVTAFFHPG